MARIRPKAWPALMMVLALALLVSSLIPSAAAAPSRRPHLPSKRDVGNQETVPLTLVQSTDVAQLGIAPSPHSVGSNDPAKELFPPNHDFEQEMGSDHGGGSRPDPSPQRGVHPRERLRVGGARPHGPAVRGQRQPVHLGATRPGPVRRRREPERSGRRGRGGRVRERRDRFLRLDLPSVRRAVDTVGVLRPAADDRPELRDLRAVRVRPEVLLRHRDPALVRDDAGDRPGPGHRGPDRRRRRPISR